MNIEGTLGDLLDLIGSDETLTPPIIQHLRTMADRELASLAAMSGLKLAGEIRTATEGTVEQPLAVANRLRQIITETFNGSDKDTAHSTGPIQVEVRQEKTLAQYNLGELLAALAADPTRYAEINPFLEREPQFAAALQKSVNLGIPTDGNKLDPAGTTTYIMTLARPFAKAQRMVGDKRPAPIEKLLGLEVRALIHPFTFEPVQGPDENGFDWGTLSDQLHKALLWAHVTRNAAWPTTIDPFQHGTEIFTDPLPTRWQRILEDYEAACAADETNIVTSRYHTAESAALVAAVTAVRPGRGVHAPVTPAPEPQQPDYCTLLEELGDRAGNLEYKGSMGNLQGGVYKMVSISGSMCNIAPGTIVMRGGRISGSMNSGVIYAPLGVKFEVAGSMCDVRVVHKTYEELAQIAGIR